MGPEITVQFSSRAAAGAALSWCDYLINHMVAERMEARRHGDRIYVRNATTEIAGIVAVKRALVDAGVEKFQGHEQEEEWQPTVK